jgi:hypothetical protein
MLQSGTPGNGAAANTWVNLMPTTMLLPLAGEYVCSAQGEAIASGAGACTMYQAFYLGVPSTVIGVLNNQLMGGASWTASFAVPVQRITSAAGGALGVAGSSNTTNCAWSGIGLTAMPLRVGG